MRIKTKLILLATLYGTSACNTTGVDLDTYYNDVDRIFSQEGKIPNKRYEIRFDNGKVQFNAPSIKKPKENVTQNSYRFTGSLNEKLNYTCTFFKKRMDPANFARRSLHVLKNAKGIYNLRFHQNKVKSVGHYPMLITSYTYNMKKNNQILIGLYQIAQVDYYDKTLLCEKDGAYKKLFENVVTQIAASAKMHKRKKPLYGQIFSLNMNLTKTRKITVGYVSNMVFSKGSNKANIIQTSIMHPGKDGNGYAIDSIDASLFDSKGKVKKMTSMAIENDQNILDLNIKHTSGKTYKVKGKYRSESISKTITCSYPFVAASYQLDFYRRAPQEKSIKYSDYIPNLDIGSCTNGSYKRVGKKVYVTTENSKPVTYFLNKDYEAYKITTPNNLSYELVKTVK